MRPYAELRTLVAILTISAFAWVFLELADTVIDGETHAIDTALLLALRNPLDPSDPLGPGWIEELGRDITALGGVGVLTMLTLAVAGLLWLQGRHHTVWFLLVSVGGGLLVSTLAKYGFDRPRPDLVPHGSRVYTASFPSGHSMMAAVAYLTLAVILARSQRRRILKIYLLVVAASLTVAVGVSRVYLGVHWPSDVLAGWVAGAAWALLCWLVAQRLEASHAIEPEADENR
ncbi:MAG TPA: phosphatase PAP2 family protein [Methylomirabilota bacterium]|nr:phosphatase PAP2 family protein [Methylomirabilota bacterium]